MFTDLYDDQDTMRSKTNLFHKFLLCFSLFFFLQINAQKTEDIEGVTIQASEKKYKNKKENPAYRIMQEVWKRKHLNTLENYSTYSYNEYEKIEFDLNNIDSSFMQKKVFNKLDFIFAYADSTANGKLALPIFLNESVYKNIAQNQPEKKAIKKLTAQKTSGFQDNQIISLTAKNLYKDINIYDNTLNFFNLGLQSPVSTEGFSTYNYLLSGEISINRTECYKIQYDPKRNDVLAFQGFLYISKDSYAIVKATLRSTQKMNINFVNSVSAVLEYDSPNGDAFLPSKSYTEFDLSMLGKNKSAKGMTAKRTTVYSDYQLNIPIEKEVFNTVNEESPTSLAKNEAFWENNRTDSLSTTEKGVYEMLGKLEQTPKFTRMVKLYETLASGYYNVGKAIDIGDLYSTVGFNDVEGTRIRMGARTYFSQNDTWRVQGYGAYGFKDRQFKYGAEAKFMLNKNNRLTVGAGSRRDIMQLGVQLTTDDGIMSRSFASSSIFSSGQNASLSSVNQTNVFVSVEPWKNLQLRADGTLQSIKSANPAKFSLAYFDNDGNLRKTLNDSHVTLSVVARPGAKFSQTGVDRYEHTTLSPTFVLKYTRGIEGLFNADFGYNKLQFLYTQPILVGTWGKTLVNLEAGKNFDTVPLALQNIIPGNQSYSLVPNTFALLNYYEFVADTYSTLHLEHHFNGKILSYIPLIKKLKLREVAFLRSAYGTLSDASKQKNVEVFKYSAPSDKIYYEYGFGIENIGFGNLRILRVDFNWRGNYLQNPEAKKFGIKAGLQMNF